VRRFGGSGAAIQPDIPSERELKAPLTTGGYSSDLGERAFMFLIVPNEGLALEATVKGPKYWKDSALNGG
jgi:hypothetical protein